MSISIYPISQNFAAEIGDVDLSAPISSEDWSAIQAAFWRYAVVIFPGQKLNADQHLDFAARFGPLETEKSTDGIFPHRIRKELGDISNLDISGSIWNKDSQQRAYKMANMMWHTDSSFKHRPSLCSLLYSHKVAPIGGHTEFADERAAYDALPQAMKQRLQGMIARHSIATSRKRTGQVAFSADDEKRLAAVPQLMVRTIPQNGRKSLYLASHIGSIDGMQLGESETLLEQLIAHTTQRQFVYTHRWREQDLVMWDNRCTMHRGTEYDDFRWVREMHRATVSDVANSCEQEKVAVPA